MMNTLRNNVDNEPNTGMPRGKADLGKGRVTRATRTALTDIGNKPAARPKKIAQVLKPSRGLVRKKATEAPPNRPVTRSSAGKHEVAAAKDEKVTGMETEAADPAVFTAFSTNYLENVENIDKDDMDNPQLVTEYVNEIYLYLLQLETSQSIREDYLNKTPTGAPTILPKMRAVLIDWLTQVHQQFNLLQETLYLTVAIVDRYLQDVCGKMERKQLQLVGVSAMFIASKYEEMYAPEIGDFVYITDQAYTESQIRQMEIKILDALGFQLGRPLPLHFLRRNSKAGNVDALTHTLAKYILELTLVDYKVSHVKPSMVAAAALALSLKVLDQDEKSIRELWTPTLKHYTTYNFDTISGTVEKLASITLTTSKADPEKAKLMAVRKKYEDKKLSRIACLKALTGQSMEQLARGDF